MTFLEEFRASRGAGASDRSDAQATVLREWITSRLDAMFDELREHAPIFVAGDMAFVARYVDVQEVLARNDVFSVEPYADVMMRINRGPNFLLGMDDGPEYQEQLLLLHRAIHRDDMERVRRIVSARAAGLLLPALAAGRLELTDGFGRLVPALFVADYFGVPGPDPATLATWARTIFTDGFANVLRLPLFSRKAMEASEEFRAYLDGLIAGIKADRPRASSEHDTIAGRLIALQQGGEPALPDARIRDNLLWSVSGMLDNVNTAVCTAIDCLLGKPDIMKGAADAALAQDSDLLRQYVLEALRFRTPTPVLLRRCVRDHTLARGTPREKTLPAGTQVFAGVGAAMMDRTAIDDPKTFRLDRPPDRYLHFGAGLHQCLGRHIAEAHLTEMVGRLVKLDGLRRARGLAGRLRFAGPFPKKFVVEFEPSGMPA